MPWKTLSKIISISIWTFACANVDLDKNDSPNPTDTDNAQDTGDTDEGSDTQATKDTEKDTETVDNICGDSNQGINEQCDDGNTDPGDGCSSKCNLEHCGDGLPNPTTVPAHREDFEDGTLPDTNWTQGADFGFEITDDYAHNGSYSIRPSNSGISSSVARVLIESYTDGTICFWLYGRSSNNWFLEDYDYLYFYVDGEQRNHWLGIHTSWEEYCLAITPGWRTFSWEYEKDVAGSSEIDSFYIDDIRFADAYLEQCDDGNNTSGDGCSATCEVE